jgi:hypothetical protein
MSMEAPQPQSFSELPVRDRLGLLNSAINGPYGLDAVSGLPPDEQRGGFQKLAALVREREACFMEREAERGTLDAEMAQRLAERTMAEGMRIAFAAHGIADEAALRRPEESFDFDSLISQAPVQEG